ncbi:MAG: DNA mismatch repair protein MutS [Bacilli bacterium]|nr:DNA mismatch repair protein MutS [Bacilli bacterium]MBN2877418.1 DNA mismatch repair protein MutS [Bacilli bacterium]
MNEIDPTIYTPMMQQYLEIKKDYSDYIVFFRLGDFYEMFFQDALVASKELEIVLTGRDAGTEERVPMCGIPYHAANIYLEKLVEKGYKVAIVEQVEDPALAKGIVKREVIKLVTPGTIIEDGTIDQKDNNYIVAVSETKAGFILAFSDLTTGENYLEQVPNDVSILFNEILNLNVKEVVIPSKLKNRLVKHYLDSYEMTISVSDEINLPSYYRTLVSEVYDKELIHAFARLVNYLEATQKKTLIHLQKVQVFTSNSYLRIDNNSKKNLELTETLRRGSKQSTLFWLLDKCETAMGSRYLKQSIHRPLIDKTHIEKRYDFVESLTNNFILRSDIQDQLKKVYDLERIVGRISFGNCNAKDLVNLKKSLGAVPEVQIALQGLGNSFALELSEKIPNLEILYNLIDQALIENPPLSIKEGGFINEGYNSTLDEIRNTSKNTSEWLEAFVERERERTGIKKLKVGYNRVFGYYIEITRGQLDLVKEEFGYIRKQTLTNSERFITEELKEKEAMILGANEAMINLEYDLFLELRETLKDYTIQLQELARILSEIDMMTAFSIVSTNNRYIRPTLIEERRIDIEDGRHPVVEQISGEVYVANGIHMKEKDQILLITGPNMSGKSTYMRQLALIIILAQIGCFVPAKTAELPVFDQIFTRIGASDDLTSGMSTFMVEMIEVNYALQNATEQSLILFDEIGRGTATYDGMALAQAIIEYSHHKINCKILFSTHYHELTYLEDDLKALHNVHVKAREENGDIVFMHKVMDGPTDRSYGIHVAKLAKLPNVVINRSKQILEELERNHGYNIIKPQTVDLFNYEETLAVEDDAMDQYKNIIDQLAEIDIMDMTPIKAMNILNDTIEEIKKLKK